ncbi:hypothetical protein [Pseudomonas frederiksbergensis]|uniref:Uncharacterized protein n=1 Tax=Pseudomonas frederiksbergensis TaxID=104087 RepID=A0A423KFW2_9PSED|nr:hypothetical protein [Pseudomonas frederiksbergensis]RON51699.1 hypothetical protein BK665_17670 [Pseudomonas frederiksbergensis]
MSAAQKLDSSHVRKSALNNSFNGSIDRDIPLPFQATFSRVNYPQEGEPPRWTIEARYRDSQSNHIKSIRIIFFKDPSDNAPHKIADDFKIIYANTEEDPPSEYSATVAMIAVKFDAGNQTIKGEISASVTDGLVNPKFHDITAEFDLAAQ